MPRSNVKSLSSVEERSACVSQIAALLHLNGLQFVARNQSNGSLTSVNKTVL